MRFTFAWALSLTCVLLGTSEAQSRPPLGTNLTGLDDWSTEFTFLDAFKTSRPWFSGSSTVLQDTRPLDLDARGWVRSLQSGQVARTLMFWSRKYPASRYEAAYARSGASQYGQ